MRNRIDKKFIVIISILMVCIAVAIIVILQNTNKPKFEHEGWINCMPMLDSKQAELCKQAEEADYPYIAY